MASLGLGLFLGGSIIAIPVVTGVAEGVEHQRKQNEEAANETRMIKFNIHVSCDADDEIADEVDGGMLVLRYDRVWVVPRSSDGKQPLPPDPTKPIDPPLHAFAGFYIQYPDDARCPAERGLVSTISDDPPMLNWIYVDNDSYSLRYGNRSTSITHMVGAWDWTTDETHVMLDGWEGFVVIDEWDGEDEDDATAWGKEGLRWAVYFDRDDDALKGRRKGRDMFEIALERKPQSEEEQLKQLEDADKKMQVKSRGGLSTQFTAPAQDRKAAWAKNNKGKKENAT